MYGDGEASNLDELRQNTIDKLTELYSQDKITVEDFESRVDQINHAESPGEIYGVISGLPMPKTPPTPNAGNKNLPYRINTGAAKASSSVINVFSGSSRKGMWKPAKSMNVISVFGGSDLDFRNAAIPPEGCTVRAYCVFGGTNIIVPPGVNVNVNGFALFGGFDSKGLEGDYPDALTIDVTGFAVFGGVDVKVK